MMNNSVHKQYIPHSKNQVVWRQLINLRKVDLPNMINPHRWLKHFPNQSSTSHIRKIMSELSRVMKKHAIGWVGNKI